MSAEVTRNTQIAHVEIAGSEPAPSQSGPTVTAS